MNKQTHLRKITYLMVPLLLLVCTNTIARDGRQKSKRYQQFDIPAQPVESALVQLSVQSGKNIIGLTESIKGIQSYPVSGLMLTRKALELLLKDTGLSYRLTGKHSFSIVKSVASVQPRKNFFYKRDRPLEEVVVAGSKRSVDLQKTPIAITHINLKKLGFSQTQDLRDFSSNVPGLQFVTTGPQESVLVQLRGVGTTNITEIADGPVSIHIDDIYSPRSQGVSTLLHDVNRIEVLRGPQGTLFGRNSSSGSLNVYNNLPTFDQDLFDIELGFGNYSQRSLYTVANWAVSNKFSLRFSGAVRQHDAFTGLLNDYSGLGHHYPNNSDELESFDRGVDLDQDGLDTEDRTSWRLSTLWQPLNNLDVFLSAERYTDDSSGTAKLDPTLVDQGIRGVVLDTKPFVDLTNDVVRGRIDYRSAGGITGSYLLGVAEMSRRQLYDTDQGRTGDFEVERTESSEFDFYSHEFHIRNSDDARLRWIAGVFASHESNSIVFAVDQQNAGGSRLINDATNWISGQAGAGVAYAIQPERRSESLAAFTQAGYDINEHSRFTVGVRYNKDTKSDIGGRAINCRKPSIYGPYLDQNALGSGAPEEDQIYIDPLAQDAINAGKFYDNGTSIGITSEPCWVRQVNDVHVSWHNVSGLLRYDIDFNDDVLLYGSVSTGFKTGHVQDAGNTAKPETVISYELGVKSQFLNDSLRLNGALFQADYEDLQFSGDDRIDTNGDGVPDSGGSTKVRNAPVVKARGLELELEWASSPHDFFQASLTLLDAHFERFNIPDSMFGNLFNPFSDITGRTALDNVDLSGNALPRTPKWKFSLGYQRDFEFSPGLIQVGGLATLSDEYYLDIYNRDRLPAGVFDSLPDGGNDLGLQSAYAHFDLNVKYQSKAKTWSLEAYVKNISDENIKLSSGNFITENGFIANYLPPRTYGVTFKYSM